MSLYLGLRQPEMKYGLGDLVASLAAPSSSLDGREKDNAIYRQFREQSNVCDLMAGKEVFRAGPVNANRFAIPGDYFRALTTQPGSSGGYLVGTETTGHASNLRPRGVLNRLPVQRMDGLTGNVSLPRGVGASTATWQATETEAVAATAPTLGSITLAAKTLIGTLEVSGALTRGMGAAGNAWMTSEVRYTIDEAAARAFFNGAGGAEPVGLLNVPGINAQAGAALSWASVLDMLRLAELSCEDDSTLAWVCAPDAAKILRARERASGNGNFIIADGRIAGLPCVVSATVPNGTLIVADWSRVVVASWGAIEVEVTGMASSAHFNAGMTAVRCIASVDFAVTQPSVVVAATSIT